MAETNHQEAVIEHENDFDYDESIPSESDATTNLDPSIEPFINSVHTNIITFKNKLYDDVVINNKAFSANSKNPMKLFMALYLQSIAFWMNPFPAKVKPDLSKYSKELNTVFDSVSNEISDESNLSKPDVSIFIFNLLYTLSTTPVHLK
jgi:hypothetical protein